MDTLSEVDLMEEKLKEKEAAVQDAETRLEELKLERDCLACSVYALKYGTSNESLRDYAYNKSYAEECALEGRPVVNPDGTLVLM